ncbi:hypothetical protein [Kosakonia sp. 1610]|uniref:hypothetical protein n=1 Tax=Kosakonia sp. 1610 TaxID=3156426 RepID=UPI003D1978DF
MLSVGVLECWSVGVLECWSVGVLECWSVGVLECWSGGVVVYLMSFQNIKSVKYFAKVSDEKIKQIDEVVNGCINIIYGKLPTLTSGSYQ